MSADGGGFFEGDRRPLVLYVLHHHEFSGAETLQIPVLRADPRGLVACPPGSRAEELVKSLGLPTVPLSFRTLRHSGGRLETLRSAGRGLAGARDLRRVMRERPERRIVYCVSIRSAMLAAIASLGMRRRLVWTLPDLMPPAPLRQAVRMLARLACDRAIALSQVIADDFAGGSRRLRRPLAVIHPGPELERYPRPSTAPRPPHVAVLGAVSPTKRTDLAIEIASRLAAEVGDFRLDVIGRAQFREEDFAYERDLHERVEHDERLSRRVRFVGYEADVAGRLRDCRVLLHCRPDEPFGMVLVEAMAAGAAVVAPGAAGPLEIVDHGRTGFLYAPGDAAEAAGHLARLLRDPDEAARMGAAGRERVEQHFTAELQVAAVERVLEEVAGR
ncbi:MAG: glycosyltransferase family 4 protein [Thermoleophilaceae bacterium]